METNTIVKRQNKLKELLLEQFKKTPIVQIACEKVGVGRATYYRWRKDDEEFATLADSSIHDGRLFINDMAESQLISEIKNKNMTAIIFWLKHHHQSFSTRVEIIARKAEGQELTVEQKGLLEKALELAALLPENPPTKKRDETNNNT